jgi:hypothetical protein
VQQPGAVRSVKFRPSFYHQFFNTYQALSSPERAGFLALIHKEQALDSFSSRPILDAGINYMDYVSNERPAQFKAMYETYRKDLLNRRASLGPSTPEEIQRVPELRGETRPDLGHDAWRIHLGQGYRDSTARSEAFTALTLKSPYHDLLNNDLGYTRYAHIEFPWIELQYDWRKKDVRVERLSALATTSLMPFSFLDKRLSWHFDAGLYTARDYGCADCSHYYAEGGVGGALGFGGDRHRLYAMALVRPEVSDHLRRGFRPLAGIQAGILMTPTDLFKTALVATQYWNTLPEHDSTEIFSLRWENSVFLKRNWELRQSNSLEMSDFQTRPNAQIRLESLFFFK